MEIDQRLLRRQWSEHIQCVGKLLNESGEVGAGGHGLGGGRRALEVLSVWGETIILCLGQRLQHVTPLEMT